MQRFLVILCAASSLVFANVNRGLGHPSRPHGDDDHLHHAHTHFHDGVGHTHWHSHDLGEDHAQPDPKGDHHEEIGHGDHGDHPYVPAPAPVSVGRTASGKHLGLVPITDLPHALPPPALRPAKPPPRARSNQDNLHRLRTVILLT